METKLTTRRNMNGHIGQRFPLEFVYRKISFILIV